MSDAGASLDRLCHDAARGRLNAAARASLVRRLLDETTDGVHRAIAMPQLHDAAPAILAECAPLAAAAAAVDFMRLDHPWRVKRHAAQVALAVARRCAAAGTPVGASDELVRAASVLRAAVIPSSAMTASAEPHKALAAAAGEVIEAALDGKRLDIVSSLRSPNEADQTAGLVRATIDPCPETSREVCHLLQSSAEVGLAAVEAVDTLVLDESDRRRVVEELIAHGSRSAMFAADIARRLECAACVPALLERVDRHTTDSVQDYVARSLGGWPEPRPSSIDDAAIVMLESPDDAKRWLGARMISSAAVLARRDALERRAAADPSCAEVVKALVARATGSSDDGGELDVRRAAMRVSHALLGSLRAMLDPRRERVDAERGRPMVVAGLTDEDPSVRRAAMLVLRERHDLLTPEERDVAIQRALGDSRFGVRSWAILAALESEAPSDAPSRSPSGDLRRAARIAMRRLAPQQLHAVLGQEPGWILLRCELSAILRALDHEQALRLATHLASLPAEAPEFDRVRRELLRSVAPGAPRLAAALPREQCGQWMPELAASARLPEVRAQAMRRAVALQPPPPPAWRVERMLLESDASVRAALLQAMDGMPHEPRRALIESGLRDPSETVIAAAVDAIGSTAEATLHAPAILAALSAGAIQDNALLKVIRVLGAAMPDALAARGLLRAATIAPGCGAAEDSVETNDAHIARAAFAALDQGDPAGARTQWPATIARIEAIRAWAMDVGQRLTGAPVTMRPMRGGAGMTHEPGGDGVITIYIDESPIIDGVEHGDDIVRGLVIHELGHHVCDFSHPGFRGTWKRAASAGCGGIYNALLDERLERHMRTIDPAFGTWLDRLRSHVFFRSAHQVPAGELAEALRVSLDALFDRIESRTAPGRLRPGARALGADATIELTAMDALRLPVMSGTGEAWMACVRGGCDPAILEGVADPEVLRRAMQLVPDDLRRRSHAEVVSLARTINRLLRDSDQAMSKRRTERSRALMRSASLRTLDAFIRRAVSASHASDGAVGVFAPTPDSRITRRSEAMTKRLMDRLRWSRPGRYGGRSQPNEAPNTRFSRLPSRPWTSTSAKKASSMAALRQGLGPEVRRLREHFERLGLRRVDEYGARAGATLDLAAARRAAVVPTIDLLVRRRDTRLADCYVGLVIDRSGSMNGQRMDLARKFALLVVDAMAGIAGIGGQVCAFDSDALYVLGDVHAPSTLSNIASLESGGGNNDAGALHRAAEFARSSTHSRRVLVMVSDSEPTECSVIALRTLVEELEAEGVVCAQVAVAHVAAHTQCFRHFLDVSRMTVSQALERFGSLITRLTMEATETRRKRRHDGADADGDSAPNDPEALLEDVRAKVLTGSQPRGRAFARKHTEVARTRSSIS
ncbi:MAG: VWA domain-containing protein [Phycisphaerales bacterium]